MYNIGVILRFRDKESKMCKFKPLSAEPPASVAESRMVMLSGAFLFPGGLQASAGRELPPVSGLNGVSVEQDTHGVVATDSPAYGRKNTGRGDGTAGHTLDSYSGEWTDGASHVLSNLSGELHEQTTA